MEPDKRLMETDLTDVRGGVVVPAALLFAAIAVLIGVDVVSDYRSGTRVLHLVVELFIMALSLAGVVVLWRLMRRAQNRAAYLSADLEAARAEAKRFSAEARDALRGLGEAIDRQFQRWGLTGAEAEVGLLLLKGLTHREIGELRSTSEATVRQQALAVYRKAGLRGRTELSAFFLEDLLLPADVRQSRADEGEVR
jgi:DNA-binding NarL/FixJ family response regulator